MSKVYLIGDSLMQDYNIESYPQVGYGTTLRLYAKENVEVVNLAKAGCSTKSFLDQNRFKIVEEMITKDDLLIVEFGNNDEKDSDPFRYTDKDTTFIENLNYFKTKAIERGAKVIFATSPTRRTFENGLIIDSHKGYPQTMVKWCKENELICIDLNEITKDLYNLLGEIQTKKFHLIFGENIYTNFNEGKNDNSHYNQLGCIMVCESFLTSLLDNHPGLMSYFKHPKINKLNFMLLTKD